MCTDSCKKSISERKSGIFVFCTTKECDNIATPYYPVSTLFSIKWSLTRALKQIKEKFKRLALKVVLVPYKRFQR